MEFYQHVYGRVAKGYEGSQPGYQLAALTDKLASRFELLEKLNRFSFFNLRGGRGTEARYSFYRPAEGFLAFGCSRYARDRTGSIGSFAHHFVCEEKQFIESSISPVDLLKSLPFGQNENQLDQLSPNRSLKLLEFHPNKLEQTSEEWRSFALRLVDMYLGKSEPVIPMVVASDDDTWSILAELFSLLPRFEASRLSFSTLFTEATDFVEGFRLVFVPDRKYVPTGTYVYQVIVPTETLTTLPKPVAFTSFWREKPDQAQSLLKFTHILRHVPERMKEAAALLPDLLSLGQIFRDCVETLQIPRLFNLILRDAKWIVTYWQVGAPLSYDRLSMTLWENPEDYLTPLLTAVAQLRQVGLRDLALEDLARQTADGQTDLQLIEALPTTSTLQRFYEIAGKNLDLPHLRDLATKLRGKVYYDNQLHLAVAHHILARIAEDYKQRWMESERWLQDETKVLSESFIQAVVDLTIWVDKEGSIDFELGSYRIGQQQYATLLEATWTAGNRFLSAWDLIRTIFRTDYRNEFFAFFARKLHNFNLGLQKELLQAVTNICRPHGVDNEHLIEAIRLSEDSPDLAGYLREQLSKLPLLDERAILSLKAIEQQSRWRRPRFF